MGTRNIALLLLLVLTLHSTTLAADNSRPLLHFSNYAKQAVQLPLRPKVHMPQAVDDTDTAGYRDGISGGDQGLNAVGSSVKGSAAMRIGDACSTDDECADIGNANCPDATCQCNVGFVPLSRLACLPLAAFIGDSCVVTSQCTHLNSNAICYKGRCLCEPQYYIAAKKCVPTAIDDDYGVDHGGTFSTIMMMLMMNASPNAVIDCHRKKNLGDSCCSTKQCAYRVDNSECRVNVCACRAGHVPIGQHVCAKKATALGGACSVDAQCSDIMESECKPDGFCWCSNNSTPSAVVTGRQFGAPMCLQLANLGESCTAAGQCTARTRNSQCNSTTMMCECATGYVRRDNEVNECLPLVNNVGGDYCTVTRQCTVRNTLCSIITDKCQCDPAFCEPEIPMLFPAPCVEKVGDGSPCMTACECQVEGSTCSANTCQCPTGFRANNATFKCEPLTLNFFSSLFVFSGQFCCQANTTADQFVGQAYIAPMSTDNSIPIFTDDSDIVSIDEKGVVSLEAGTVINDTIDFTITATSSILGTLIATTTVELRPSVCCTMPLTVTTSTITVALVDGDPTPATGCDGVPAAAPALATNAADLVDVEAQTFNMGGMTMPLELFPHPCNADAAVTVSQLVLTSGTLCAVDPLTNTIDWIGVTADTAVANECAVAGLVTGCNGIASAFEIMFEIAVCETIVVVR